MKDLVDKVKRECVGLFVEATESCNPCWGVDMNEASLLLYLLSIDKCFSKLDALFLPRPLRKFIWNTTNETFHKYIGGSAKDLYVYHYPLKIKTLKRNVRAHLETENWIYERRIAQGVTNTEKPLSVEETVRKILLNMSNDPACIHLGIWQQTIIAGPRIVTQEVMDYLKEQPQDVFKFISEVTNRKIDETINESRERFGNAHLYDLLSKPREVHFSI